MTWCKHAVLVLEQSRRSLYLRGTLAYNTVWPASASVGFWDWDLCISWYHTTSAIHFTMFTKYCTSCHRISCPSNLLSSLIEVVPSCLTSEYDSFFLTYSVFYVYRVRPYCVHCPYNCPWISICESRFYPIKIFLVCLKHSHSREVPLR